METLIFSYNWNNKLNCESFTTIRLPNRKYVPGAQFKVILTQGKNLTDMGVAEVEEAFKVIPMHLTNLTCRQDTGYSKEETLRMISNMYKNVPGFNVATSIIYLVLLRKIKIETQGNPEPSKFKDMFKACPNCQKAWTYIEVQSQSCDFCNWPDNND